MLLSAGPRPTDLARSTGKDRLMLQTNKGPVQSLAFEPHRDFDAGSVVDAFQAMLGLVRRHWPLFILLPALLLGCGGALSFRDPAPLCGPGHDGSRHP